MTNISFSKNVVEIAGINITLEYVILEAFEFMGKVIVLFDPDENISKFGQFNNLVAFDMSGKKLWEAELPTAETGDCYFKIYSTDPLRVGSFKSYICEIDGHSGRIVSKEFTK